jgi:hypothetical protein
MRSSKESERRVLQARLDAERTQRERNERGQFATPAALAADIVSYARTLLPARPAVRFLDPAFGTGAFYSALLSSVSKNELVAAWGIEVDPHHARHAMELWRETPLDLRIADFTKVAPPASEDEKATLVVCNPPYVRHHHLPSREKTRLRLLARRNAGVSLGGLSGLYCYFLAITHAWMADRAIAGWLIPSEFMDVNYGQAVKDYLLQRVTLLRIHRYDPHDTQFEDALVSSAVVWFKNAPPPSDHDVSFTVGGTLSDPAWSRLIPLDTLARSPKWTPFFLAERSHQSESEMPRLSDFFDIKRGLATGANSFFVLDAEQVDHYRLPTEFLVPILPSPRFLTSEIIDADEAGQPLLGRTRFLLSCNLPEEKVQARYPALWKYLQTGVEAGISARYLCTHRSPWYAQEARPPAPFLCTYMGRSENGQRKPFRFILNHSQATAPNVYLMLYPKPSLSKLLKARPALHEAVWQALHQIPVEALIGEGRVYGGGLYKLEPKELGNAPADGVITVLTGLTVGRERQKLLFS